MTFSKALITVAILAHCGSAWAADADRNKGFGLNIGFDYTSGKYGGTDRNTVTAIPVSAKYTSGPVTLRLSVSWLQISGTGVVTSGIGGASSDDGSSNSGKGNSNSGSGSSNSGSGSSNSGSGRSSSGGTFGAARTTETGFGDVVAGLTYNLLDRGGLLLDITGKIKLPTASESRGLGNGKTDYALLIEAEQAVGRAFVDGVIGHKWLGEPAGINLRNPWFGAVGAGYRPSSATTFGISYDYTQSSRSGGVNGQELTLYASQRLSKNIKLNANLFKGLSDGSPDWGAGINLGYSF